MTERIGWLEPTKTKPRAAVKQGRWLLHENLKDGQAVQLQELLAANQPLATV